MISDLFPETNLTAGFGDYFNKYYFSHLLFVAMTAAYLF